MLKTGDVTQGLSTKIAYYLCYISDYPMVPACMVVTFREVYSAIKKLKFKEGNNIVIYGTGAVGLVFITFAKMLGI